MIESTIPENAEELAKLLLKTSFVKQHTSTKDSKEALPPLPKDWVDVSSVHMDCFDASSSIPSSADGETSTSAAAATAAVSAASSGATTPSSSPSTLVSQVMVGAKTTSGDTSSSVTNETSSVAPSDGKSHIPKIMECLFYSVLTQDFNDMNDALQELSLPEKKKASQIFSSALNELVHRLKSVAQDASPSFTHVEKAMGEYNVAKENEETTVAHDSTGANEDASATVIGDLLDNYLSGFKGKPFSNDAKAQLEHSLKELKEAALVHISNAGPQVVDPTKPHPLSAAVAAGSSLLSGLSPSADDSTSSDASKQKVPLVAPDVLKSVIAFSTGKLPSLNTAAADTDVLMESPNPPSPADAKVGAGAPCPPPLKPPSPPTDGAITIGTGTGTLADSTHVVDASVSVSLVEPPKTSSTSAVTDGVECPPPPECPPPSPPPPVSGDSQSTPSVIEDSQIVKPATESADSSDDIAPAPVALKVEESACGEMKAEGSTSGQVVSSAVKIDGSGGKPKASVEKIETNVDSDTVLVADKTHDSASGDLTSRVNSAGSSTYNDPIDEAELDVPVGGDTGTKPTAAMAKKSSLQVGDSPWWLIHDPDASDVYYFNTATQKSAWNLPLDVATKYSEEIAAFREVSTSHLQSLSYIIQTEFLRTGFMHNVSKYKRQRAIPQFNRKPFQSSHD